jgi:hypothetical protein
LKNSALALATLLIVVTAGCTGLFSGYLGANPSSGPNMAPVEEKLHLDNISAAKDNGCLNVSLTIRGTADEAIQVNELRINGVSQNDLAGLTVYLNGTSIVKTASPLFIVENVDNLRVTLVLPVAFPGGMFNSGFVKVDVATPDVLYYTETSFT